MIGMLMSEIIGGTLASSSNVRQCFGRLGITSSLVLLASAPLAPFALRDLSQRQLRRLRPPSRYREDLRVAQHRASHSPGYRERC